MPGENTRTFKARLMADGTALNWVVAPIPFDVPTTWPKRKRLRVKGEIEGFHFRTSLVPASMGKKGYVLLVNKAMQRAAGAGVGMEVRITLEPDLEERTALIPEELERSLKADRRLKPYLAAMSDSHQREIGKWVAEPKTPATRMKRAEQMAERLLQALEGETETPPVLEAAFQEQPLARQGWKALTPTQRRDHLLGIFYYASPEARARRAAKAVEDSLKVAAKLPKGK